MPFAELGLELSHNSIDRCTADLSGAGADVIHPADHFGIFKHRKEFARHWYKGPNYLPKFPPWFVMRYRSVQIVVGPTCFKRGLPLRTGFGCKSRIGCFQRNFDSL